MGGLVLNPDHTHEPTVKLSDRVFDDEINNMVPADELPPNEPEKVKDEEPKRTKILGFSLDTKYPRTLQGFIRVLQIFLLFVAMIATLLKSPWPDPGAFTFFVIVMVFCAFASGFLLFSIMAGNQERGGFCGMPWKKLELIYFLVGFVMVFICACIAASKANGLAALSAAAAFGFIAAISFVVCLIWAWKKYKNDDEDETKDGEKKDDEDEKSDLPQDEGAEKMQEFRINMLDETKSKMDEEERKKNLSRHNSLRRANSLDARKYNSNPDDMRNSGRFNPSDKDSAYSEGGDFERDQARHSLPNHRRTGSFHQRGSMKRIESQQRYPQELDPRTLSNHRNIHNKKSQHKNGNGVPNWLHAAMESDEETVAATPSINPRPQRGHFPLLPTSDEESVAYPSVSQTLGPNGRPVKFHNPNMRNLHHKQRPHRTMPHGGSHRRKEMGGHLHLPHKVHRGHSHHRGRGHRHSRRRKGHHHNQVQVQNGTRAGNFPEFSKPIETGSRRVIPEQPASIHFPEQSRWDDPEMDRRKF